MTDGNAGPKSARRRFPDKDENPYISLHNLAGTTTVPYTKTPVVMNPTFRSLFALATAVFVASCGDSGSGPDDKPTPGVIDFDTDLVNLFQTRATSVTLVNGTAADIGPVSFGVGTTFDVRGIDVGGVTGNSLPPVVPSVNAGGEVGVSVSLNDQGLPPATYETVFEARIDGVTKANVRLRFEVVPGSPSSAVSVEITEGPAAPRQGDPVDYVADPRNDRDEQLPPEFVEWFILPTDAGDLSQEGHFIPHSAGPARIIARSGINFDTLDINITARGGSGSFELVGRGQNAGSEDVGVMGGFAYLATSAGQVETWNVASPESPVLTSTLTLDASSVPSVHIRADGQLGAAAHTGSSDALNGVTLFDLTDPSAPAVISRFTEDLTRGVTSVFLDGDHLYAVVDEAGVRIIDVSDPAAPVAVGEFRADQSFATEVIVDDGLLYVAHWNAGSIIVDVGNGAAGGSPANPQQVVALSPAGGQVAGVSLWKERDFVLLSEEDALTPGPIHLMDVSALSNATEVATWASPGHSPGSVVADPVNETLIAAWRAAGVRMLDVTGSLEGELDLQGREVAVSLYDGDATNAVRVRLAGGLLFVADGSSGLVILRPG